jgi:hypothetical protein
MTVDIEKINDIVWKNMVSGIHSLGEVILSPENFYRDTRTNKLGYADSTILLIHDLEVENISIDPLLFDGKALLNFFYNAVNTSKYDDAKTLINSTSLLRIVRYTSPASKISMFPDDAIPILKDFLIKEFKK